MARKSAIFSPLFWSSATDSPASHSCVTASFRSTVSPTPSFWLAILALSASVLGVSWGWLKRRYVAFPSSQCLKSVIDGRNNGAAAGPWFTRVMDAEVAPFLSTGTTICAGLAPGFRTTICACEVRQKPVNTTAETGHLIQAYLDICAKKY